MNIKSFTLFELVVIVVIFAVLISFAVSKISSTGDKSLGVSEQAMMAALKAAITLYYARNLTWPDGDDSVWSPFDLLTYPPPNHSTPHGDNKHWSYKRFIHQSAVYWWIHCPHNKIWWFYFVNAGMINQSHCAGHNETYEAGSLIRCKKTPITHDFE